MSIIDIRHPQYCLDKWNKWRLTYEADDEFITEYLHKFSIRESQHNFNLRRCLTYVPAFAASAVNDIKNSIFQRAIDITREGGSGSYQSAINGRNGGVDLLGSSMSYFIEHYVLKELLPMSKVGIYVDMPQLPGITKADQGSRHPYVYTYKIEDILSWTPDLTDSPNEYLAVLLRDNDYTIDPDTGLPTGTEVRYRYLYLKDKSVFVNFYNSDGDQIDSTIKLDIPKIPFHIADIGSSLLAQVANYQIALLNLESSDLAYVLLSNYPFYTEQFDPRASSEFTKSDESDDVIEVGASQGRRYPANLERPAFIHPSSEPLKASIEKQDVLKRDIRILINLAVSNLSSSAESKQLDMTNLEAGLAHIGSVLQNAEMKIGEFWSLYESVSAPTILYPEKYSLPDPENIRKEIEQDLRLSGSINSKTYRRELAKRIVHRSIGAHVPSTIIKTIESELSSADVPICDPEFITLDLEAGIVSQRTASAIRGYPQSDVEAAAVDHAKRLARIQAAQTPKVNGVPDTSVTPNIDNANEKAASRITDMNPTSEKPVRGPGR